MLDSIESPLGPIWLAFDDQALRALDFEPYRDRMEALLKRHYGSVTLTRGPAPAAAVDALKRYFDGDLAALDSVPVATAGTPFQREVWAALRQVPAARATTYGQLAAAIGRAGASRAVGLANSLNPVAIIVPCHRVIGSDGKLTGYAGGLERKSWLLAHERKHSAPPAFELTQAQAGQSGVSVG
ncbi:methylated-DNA--[protein]-cysteine S-methyltransferase [soil metagenome]